MNKAQNSNVPKSQVLNSNILCIEPSSSSHWPLCLKLGSKLRAIANLEKAVDILETQFEAIEATKVDTSDLLDEDTEEQTKKLCDT